MSNPLDLSLQEPPLLVLTSASARRGAAYGSDLKLVAKEVSEQLLQHALTHPVQIQPWLDSSGICRSLERPPWAPSGSLKGWTLYWLFNDRSTAGQRAVIPPR